ncbi:MAG: alpha/beta hydrolase-fold protein [Amylibacter sp.]
MMRTLILICVLIANITQAETLRIGSRNVVVYSPKLLSGKAAPLVIALHGGLGNARQFRFFLNLKQQADRYGFRVVYPQGTLAQAAWAPNGRVWNAGTCCGTAMQQRVDDVGYLKSVVAQFKAQGLVSQSVAVGHSNGAMMALRAACDAPNLFQRVVAIAGPLLLKTCKRQYKLSVVHLHGANDRNVPIEGGVGAEGVLQLNFPAVQMSANILEAAGAQVSIEVITATHFLGSINRGLRTELSLSLPEFVAKRITQ